MVSNIRIVHHYMSEEGFIQSSPKLITCKSIWRLYNGESAVLPLTRLLVLCVHHVTSCVLTKFIGLWPYSSAEWSVHRGQRSASLPILDCGLSEHFKTIFASGYAHTLFISPQVIFTMNMMKQSQATPPYFHHLYDSIQQLPGVSATS